jgi:(S)-2-hydroxyglutarate dehydrogenase
MFDVIIVGAGIVGLATAYRLQEKNQALKIAVIEKENEVAAHQTGNNSGVIHSGIYYKPGSLKASNCVRGVNMLIEFSRHHGIAHDICGKIIVATEEKEQPLLHNIFQRGVQNGLDKIRKISADEAREIEPHVHCIAAIHVPYTGIISYKEVAEKLSQLIQQQGGQLLLNNKVENISITDNEVTVATNRQTVKGKFLINCAGLYADKIARLTHPGLDLLVVPFRGEYYELKKEKEYLVKHLIYPVPNPDFPFLGVHFTRMIKGGIEAGPNAVFAFSREGYKNTDFHCKEFAEAILYPGFQKISKKYWRTGWMELRRSFSKKLFTETLQKLIPELKEEDLLPGGSGVRAQAIDRNGNLIDDFYFLESKRVINVCNAPSPAATSSLSIGLTIAEKVLKQF